MARSADEVLAQLDAALAFDARAFDARELDAAEVGPYAVALQRHHRRRRRRP